MVLKTIAEWEKEKGFIIKDADPEEKLTEDEVNKIDIAKKLGVNHEDRIKFLKDNGYEVTRDNMVNSELSSTQEIKL